MSESSKEKAKKIVIIGAGGFAREVLSWLDIYENIIFFSEASHKENSIKGHPLAMDLSTLSGYKFLVAIGDPKARERLWKMALEYHLHCPGILLARDSTIGQDVVIENGVIICPGVRVSTDIKIGTGVILNLNPTVGHDTVIEDFVTVSPGAHISGGCNIGHGAYIGTGASIRENIIIGAGAVIGMGASVINHVPENETWVGVPAKRIK